MLKLVVDDLSRLGDSWTERSIEHAMHTLDESDGSIREVLRLGNYYNAVAQMDVVYRGLRHFEANPDDIPTYPLIVVDEYQDFSEMETSFIQLLASTNKVLIAGDDDQAPVRIQGSRAPVHPRTRRKRRVRAFRAALLLTLHRRGRFCCQRGPQRRSRERHLQGRLDKEFECFVPDKAEDSEAHALIIHAKCSVQNNNAPYVGKYIVDRIQAIPAAHVEDSQDQRYPTVLVIGPNPFLDAAYKVIHETFPKAVRRKSEPISIEPLDGYRYLANDETSRLGWRIIMHCHAVAGSEDVLTEVARDEAELVELLPDDYRDHHLAMARLIGRLLDGDDLSENESATLVTAVDLPLDEIRVRLNVADAREADSGDEAVEASADIALEGAAAEPSIICTTLTSSKGLSAGHVFIVGFNDGHLPRDAKAITDDEVCQFLVGLSRTRKECHVVSVRNFGGEWLQDSAFARWMEDQIEPLNADKHFFKAA